MSILDALTYPAAKHRPSIVSGARIATNLAILAFWLWLYQPLFGYLGIIFSREDFRTNQLVLLGVLALIGLQVRRGDLRLRFDARPQLHWPALLLALGASLLYLAVERFLDVNTLSASLFGLASYGLLGLWMLPRRWRQGLPAALLLIGALPFGEHMQTFVGYPMRIVTAAIVRDGLAAGGVASVGIDTILVLENGVSQIDLPCSGVKSLWTGMLFLLAATWIKRRPLNLRWLAVALIFALLLFAVNVARVGLLVLVGQVMGWQLAAEMLHVPLGVLGFVAACGVAVGLLDLKWNADDTERTEKKRISPAPISANPQDPHHPRAILPRPAWLAPGLAVAILAMALLYTPRPQTGLAHAADQSISWRFPAELVTEPLPLDPTAIAWFTRDGAEAVEQSRFQWRGVTGSMILITSRTWRAHHRPERCFEVYGLSPDDSRPYLAGPAFPLRYLRLGDDDGRKPLSAAYWFQSADRTTDDYGARIWADLSPQRDRWVLVSILFDDVYDPSSTDIQALYAALHDTVAMRLDEGAAP